MNNQHSNARVTGALHIRLRPSLQRDAASFCQRIDALIEALKPAINIRKQYLARVRYVGSNIAHSQRSRRLRLAAQASACCRYAAIIGVRVLPPGTGSPRRLAFAHKPRTPLWIGPAFGDTELTMTLTSPASEMPSIPMPSLRQRLR